MMSPRGVSPLNVLGGAIVLIGMILTTYNIHVLHQLQGGAGGGRGGRRVSKPGMLTITLF